MSFSFASVRGAGTRRVFPAPLRRLTRAGAGGDSLRMFSRRGRLVRGGDEVRVLIERRECMEEWGECRGDEEREGVLGYEDERSVTVAVSALVCRVCTNVLDPAVEGRDDSGRGGSVSHW
jgi:hypothetical protein